MTTAGNLCAQGEQDKAILAEVLRRIGAARFDAWFKHATAVTSRPGQLTVQTATPFAANWIESHFADDLAAAAQQATGQRPRVSVLVDPQLCGQMRQSQRDRQARLVGRATGGVARRAPRPAALRHRLDDFVVGPSNRLAHSAAASIAQAGHAEFNPLFLHGTCGVGKTHLLQGICAALAQRGPSVQWKYLTAEEFTNEFVQAIRAKKLEDFRRRYRQLDVLAIDDVHFLAAKKATQEEFLHTFNSIDAAGKQVVMASDAHPRMLGQLTEQLTSRFLSGMVVKIDLPDQPTRCAILQRLADRLKIAVGPAVLDYVALHVRGSVRELEGTLIKLTALSQLTGQPVSVELARDALADHLADAEGAVTLHDIEAAVTAFFGLTVPDLHSSRRTHTVSLARSMAMLLARRHTRMSYPEIGRVMGKNHSSVVLAVQKIEKLLETNAPCRWMGPAGHHSLPARDLLAKLAEPLT